MEVETLNLKIMVTLLFFVAELLRPSFISVIKGPLAGIIMDEKHICLNGMTTLSKKKMYGEEYIST